MKNYNEAIKFLKDYFIDKKFENEKALEIYSNLDCRSQDIINLNLHKFYDYPTFLDYIKKIEKGYSSNITSFDESNILSYEDCKDASKWYNLPNVRESDPYWLYQGPVNDRDVTNGISRPFAIKLRINAYSLEEADKYWEIVEPILRENGGCFKFPKNRYQFEENLKGIEAGKFITIYTSTDEEVLKLIHKLNNALEENGIKIKEKSNIVNVDVPIGDTGVLSAVIDKDFNSNTIYEINNQRQLRRDIFFRLKDMFEEEGLIYGSSKDEIERKIKYFHFDEFFPFDKQKALELANEIYGVSAFITAINGVSKEEFLGKECMDFFTERFAYEAIELLQYYSIMYGDKDTSLINAFVENFDLKLVSECFFDIRSKFDKRFQLDLKEIFYQKYKTCLNIDKTLSDKYGTLFICKCITDKDFDKIEEVLNNDTFNLHKEFIISLRKEDILIYLRDNYQIDFSEEFAALDLSDSNGASRCGISSLLRKGMDKNILLDKIIATKDVLDLKTFIDKVGMDFISSKCEEFLEKENFEKVNFIKNVIIEKEADDALNNLDLRKLIDIYNSGYSSFLEKNDYDIIHLFDKVFDFCKENLNDNPLDVKEKLISCFEFISTCNLYDKIDFCMDARSCYKFSEIYKANEDLFLDFFKKAIESFKDIDYVEKINYYRDTNGPYSISSNLSKLVPTILLCDKEFSEKLVREANIEGYMIAEYIPNIIYQNMAKEINEIEKENSNNRFMF